MIIMTVLLALVAREKPARKLTGRQPIIIIDPATP
jgi:hypothetical protein